MANIRDRERDMFIYNARKRDKRTFSSIAKELGITAGRVSTIYHKVDWELNGVNADHHKTERTPAQEALFHRRMIATWKRYHPDVPCPYEESKVNSNPKDNIIPFPIDRVKKD